MWESFSLEPKEKRERERARARARAGPRLAPPRSAVSALAAAPTLESSRHSSAKESAPSPSRSKSDASAAAVAAHPTLCVAIRLVHATTRMAKEKECLAISAESDERPDERQQPAASAAALAPPSRTAYDPTRQGRDLHFDSELERFHARFGRSILPTMKYDPWLFKTNHRPASRPTPSQSISNTNGIENRKLSLDVAHCELGAAHRRFHRADPEHSANLFCRR